MKTVKFVHMADLHLGGWREKKLTNLNFETFRKAIDRVLELEIDFCIFAGDIFNNAMPPIDLVQKVVEQFMRLKEKKIPLYVIGGSHDYSNSGKSFIELLEKAEVFVNVSNYEFLENGKVNLKFYKDKSGTIISGILGKKNGLDKNIYSNLNSTSLSKDNFNIFCFHCTLDDLKPDFMKAVKVESSTKYLPKGFDYYAGGHVHTFIETEIGGGTGTFGKLSYPGPLFPNNFSELKRESCSFNLCEFDFQTRKTKIERIFIESYKKEVIKVEIDNLNPIDAKNLILDLVEEIDVKNKIVLLEISGIVEGKVSDIKILDVVSKLYDNSAFHVLKNTYKLTSLKSFEKEVNVDLDSKNIEDEVINEILDSYEDKEIKILLTKTLLELDLQKLEGEKNSQYEDRVYNAISKSLNK